MREKYLEECNVIEQCCTYSAEAHHIIANKSKQLMTWLQIIPAIIASLSGILVAGEIVPIWFGWLTVVSAVITSITSVLNPLKEYYDHLNAAKNFTALKHEARALRGIFSARMNDDVFFGAVENLTKRYAEFIKFVPPTDDDSFYRARKKIKSGIHKPDKIKK